MSTLDFLVVRYEIVRRRQTFTIKMMRDGLTREYKNYIRQKAVDDLIKCGYNKKYAKDLLSYCELHHIVPLSMGGSNKEDNLAYVEKNLHAKIDNYICLQPGNTILIPRHPESKKVWVCGAIGCFRGVPLKMARL